VSAQFVEIEYRDKVAWIYINKYTEVVEASDRTTVDVHAALGWALHEVRYNADATVVALTGREDGEFYSVPISSHYQEQSNRDRVNPMKRSGGFAGPAQYPDAIETLVHIEKPVLARVNGDVIGFGQSVLWGCDIIVAREDAVIADVHTGQGDVMDSRGDRRGFPQALTPGDGAMAFLPLFLPPTKLKEYMFLSKAYTARELAGMNLINYAVPLADLDKVFNDLLERLLARPPSVLAHTKRVCNKHVSHQANLAMDLSAAYEINDLWLHARNNTM
jgi:enoyl-CoA hydratase